MKSGATALKLPVFVLTTNMWLALNCSYTDVRNLRGSARMRVNEKDFLNELTHVFERVFPGQSNSMNGNYGLSPVFGLSTQTVLTRPADDIRPMVHINDHVGNMEAVLVALITERNLSFFMTGKYFLLQSIIFF